MWWRGRCVEGGGAEGGKAGVEGKKDREREGRGRRGRWGTGEAKVKGCGGGEGM